MKSCPRFPQLLRLRDAGEEAQVTSHLAKCPACASAWDDLNVLTELGQQLPDGRPQAARVESVRTRLLAQATVPRNNRISGLLVAAAAVLLVGVGGWLYLQQSPQNVGNMAIVTGHPGAIYTHRRTAQGEAIQLQEGFIAVDVMGLEPGQTIRVLTVDAVVEVRGTRFTVTARDGRLQMVEVQAGMVEVRPTQGETVHLKANERWAAPAGPSPDAPLRPEAAVPDDTPSAIPSPRPEPPRPVRKQRRTEGTASTPPSVEGGDAPSPDPVQIEPEAESTPRSPQTLRFDAGWTALRGGRAGEAATIFAQAAQMKGPLVADAHWWEAVSLGRAKRDQAAQSALERYLATYPTSARRAEASVMLGWLHFAAGRMDAAEAAFRAGTKADRAPVRHRAQEGLRAISDWRTSAP